jgi:hypothetical protein
VSIRQVAKWLLWRPLGDLTSRAYYRLFIAELDNHTAGQDYFLFSYTLMACDLLLALYLFCLSTYALLIGSSLTTNVVINACFRLVSGEVL